MTDQTKRLRERAKRAWVTKQLFDPLWQDAYDYILPYRGGGKFRRESKGSSRVDKIFDGAGPQALKEKILEARLPDGTKFGNSPEVMKLLVGLALVQNPTGVVVPGGSGDPAPGIREELKKIADTRMSNRAAYNKDTKMQERERELIGAAVKMGIMDEKGDWKK